MEPDCRVGELHCPWPVHEQAPWTSAGSELPVHMCETDCHTKPAPPTPLPSISYVTLSMYLYSAYHHRPSFSGCRPGTMCFAAHLPVLTVPGGAAHPSHYKIYISICHISTPQPPRQAPPIGPSPRSLPTATTTTTTRLPASVGSGTVSLEHLGLQVLLPPTKGTDQVLEKKYTPLQSHMRTHTHTHGESRQGLPPALTHLTQRRGSRREAEEP